MREVAARQNPISDSSGMVGLLNVYAPVQYGLRCGWVANMNVRFGRCARLLILPLSALVGLLIAVAPASAAVTFTTWPGSPFQSAADASTADSLLGVADLGTDNRPDVVRAGFGGNLLTVWGSPTLTSPVNQSAQSPQTFRLASGDVDGDGRRDLAVYLEAGKESTGVMVFRGTAGGLTPPPTPADYADAFSIDIALADFTGDGKADLLRTASDNTSVQPWTGGPAFNETTAALVAVTGTQIAGADLTGDAKADVVVAGTDGTGPFIRVLKAPSLSAGTIIRPGVVPLELGVADVTGDGRPDAVAVNASSIVVYPTAADGSLGAPKSTAVAGATGGGIAFGDFDRDGAADAALSTSSQTQVVVLRSKLDGTFDAPQAVAFGGSLPTGPIGDLAAADFDADGDVDLAVASRGRLRLDVLRNGIVLPPTARTDAPTAVGFDSATLAGAADLKGAAGTVGFQWGTTATYGTETAEQDVAAGPVGNRPVSAELTGLKPDTEYHARTVVRTGAGNNVGQDITFRTSAAPAADHAATITQLPDRVVAGVPTELRGAASGSFGPYTYTWTVDDGGSADGAQATHRFAQVQLSTEQAGVVGGQATDGGAKRGTRKVTLTVTDRFGRAAMASGNVTVLPNRAPVAAVSAVRGQLEYADPNALRNESVDPDSGPKLEYDQVAKTSWSFDGKPAFETFAGAESSPTVVPWRLDRAGKPALGELLTPTLELPGSAGSKLLGLSPEQKTRVLAEAIKQYPTVACGAAALSMFGCWPHRTEITVGVRAEDRAGAAGEAQTTLPIRLRARPAVDVTLRNPAVQTNTGRSSDSNQELPAGITTDTVLDFDPGQTKIDGKDDPAYYVLEVGKPWQLQCASGKKPPAGGIVQPQIDLPLQETARNIVLDNPLQGPTLTQPGLSAGEAVGARAQLKEGDQVSLGKGCINGVFGVNGPIKTIVATKAEQLKAAIPQEGTWSAMLSVFDRIGARGNVRLDGIRVGPVATTCQPKRGTFSGKGGFSWTGTCVSGVGDKQLSWTRNPIDLNGVRLAPAAGKVLVISGKGLTGPRVYTADGEPELITRPDGKQTYDLKKWTLGDGGKIGVVVDDQVIAKITPQRAGIRVPGSAVTTVNGALHQAFPADRDALYGGLPFADDIDVDLTASCKGGDGSRLTAQLKLPEVFKASNVTKPQTSELNLPGCNLKSKSLITKQGDARAARAVAIDGPATTKGRKAIVDAPPITLDLSGMPLGPMVFDELLLSYEPNSATFSGKGSANFGVNKVEVNVTLTDGELTRAGGTVTIGGTGIPIGTSPMSLRSLSFEVETKPYLRFVGGARITDTAGVVVSVDGTIGFQPDPLAITLDGQAAVGPGGLLSLARVHLEYADGEVSIGGYSGKSIGPFSYTLTAQGSFSSSGFNIEGSGDACVFACLGVSGVLSDRGGAMCGEIDLWLATLRPGLGVLWDGPDIDGYLDGCSIAPYRGNLKGAAAKAERLAGPYKQTVTEGETMLTAIASSGVAGRTPSVTLRGPGGRVIGTPKVLDDQVVDAGAGTLVDVDRLAGKVRFVISKPAAGEWEVTADSPDQPLTDVEFGRRVPLPTAKSFNAQVRKVPESQLGQKLFGSLLSSTAKGPKFVASPKKTKVVKIKSKAKKGAASRLATETVAVPYGHELFVSDLGPDLRKLVKTVKLDVKGLLPGDEVALVERSDQPAVKAAAPKATRSALIATPSDFTAQTIAEFTVPASGEISSTVAYLPGVNGVKKRHIDAYVIGASGIPRGVVKDITGYKTVAPSKPPLPALKEIKAAGKKLKLTFSKAPSVGLKSRATQFSAVITGKDGGVRVVSVSGADFKKVGKSYVVTVKPAGSPKGATVKLVSVGLTGQLQKGGGKVKTVKVK